MVITTASRGSTFPILFSRKHKLLLILQAICLTWHNPESHSLLCSQLTLQPTLRQREGMHFLSYDQSVNIILANAVNTTASCTFHILPTKERHY